MPAKKPPNSKADRVGSLRKGSGNTLRRAVEKPTPSRQKALIPGYRDQEFAQDYGLYDQKFRDAAGGSPAAAQFAPEDLQAAVDAIKVVDPSFDETDEANQPKIAEMAAHLTGQSAPMGDDMHAMVQAEAARRAKAAGDPAITPVMDDTKNAILMKILGGK
jgi:hypothetical protein